MRESENWKKEETPAMKPAGNRGGEKKQSARYEEERTDVYATRTRRGRARVRRRRINGKRNGDGTREEESG